jgi:glycerate dehydrogenase
MRAAALAQLPELRYIGVLATGYNIVDLEAAARLGIVVTNVPTYSTASVAQFAFALLLELCHRVGDHSAAVRAGRWRESPDWSFRLSPLTELAGKTMGIVGFGRIGRQTARIADAMGMRVLAHDVVCVDQPDYAEFRWAELNEILVVSDVVSLHCPLTADNQGIVNGNALARMKPSAFLINTSRGPLVVDQDLADALNAGTIAGAGLDVLSVEPPIDANPLLKAKNCVVTPHIAWATKEARERLLAAAVENLAAFLRDAPKNVIRMANR